MKIIIMCQGLNTRWSDDYHKQFAVIGDQPIIKRTLWQLNQLNAPQPYIVGPSDFLEVTDIDHLYTQENEIGPLLHGFQHTWHLWEDTERVVILLGDVVFSWSVLMQILDDQVRPIQFFGRPKGSKITRSPHGELFAVTFEAGQIHQLQKDINWLLEQYGCRCHLWTLYRQTIGVDFRRDQTERKILRHIEDYTEDIDSLREYEQAKDILARAIAIDDEMKVELDVN